MHGETLKLEVIGSDSAEIAGLYLDTSVSHIADDDTPARPVSVGRYVGAWVGRLFVGAFLLIEYAPRCVEAHVLLLRSAAKHSRTLGRMCLSLLFGAGAYRVTAYIRDDIIKAANYCKRIGFRLEGTMRDACMVGGKFHGVHVYGMTRADWKEV